MYYLLNCVLWPAYPLHESAMLRLQSAENILCIEQILETHPRKHVYGKTMGNNTILGLIGHIGRRGELFLFNSKHFLVFCASVEYHFVYNTVCSLRMDKVLFDKVDSSFSVRQVLCCAHVYKTNAKLFAKPIVLICAYCDARRVCCEWKILIITYYWRGRCL